MPDLAVLLAELSCGNDERAERAALRLREFGLDALTPLRELAHSKRSEQRWWAVRAMANCGPTPAVIGDLLVALEDETLEVRQCALLSLVSHPDSQAVPALLRRLGDPDGLSAQLAGNALVVIGAEAVPALIDLVENGGRSEKLAAVRALAEIHDPRAIPALMKTLAADSSLMQYWAEHGLDTLGLGMVYIKPE